MKGIKLFWPFKKKDLFERIRIGDIVYYPSIKAEALIAEILAKNEEHVVIGIDNTEYYISRAKFVSNACSIEKHRGEVIMYNTLRDPDNDIVYMRYKLNKSLIDKAYNLYCSYTGRNQVLKVDKE